MTISSPAGSSSIFTSRKATPRSFKKDLARQQSGHHLVLYMVIGSIVSSASPHWMLAGKVTRNQWPPQSHRSPLPSPTQGHGLPCCTPHHGPPSLQSHLQSCPT